MLKRYFLYSTVTGEIVTELHIKPADVILNTSEDIHSILADGDPNLKYVDLVGEPVVSDKQLIGYTINKTAISADGVDTVDLTNLPTGTLLTVGTETETESSGAISFSVDLAGTYDLNLTHPLHLDTTIQVTAS